MELAIDSKHKDDSPLRIPSGAIDRAFLTDLMKTGKESNFQEKITEYYKSLRVHVDKLDMHIDSVLQRHEQDFLNAFKCQMFSLYGQLKELKKKNDENEIRLKRDEQINKLQKSLEWFREEAIKLGESTQLFKKEADKWKAKAESLQDDRNFLENQLKNVKRKMKLMMLDKKSDSDPESDLSSQISLKEPINFPTSFVPSSKTGEIIQEYSQKHQGQVSFYYELERFFHELEIKYNESIKHLKNTLDNERKKFKQVSAQQSSMFFVKSDLETLFLSCVEEVRKDITRRKVQNYTDQKYSKRAKTSHPEERPSMTPSDKRKILELLISNEEVLIMLYEKLFPHRASQYGTSFPTGQKNEDTLPDLEEMLKQVPKKPILPKTKSFQNRGRSVV